MVKEKIMGKVRERDYVEYNIQEEDFEPRQSLAEAIRDTRNRTNLYGPFNTAKEAIDDMLRD